MFVEVRAKNIKKMLHSIKSRFDPSLLPRYIPIYSREDPLFQLIDDLPHALDEILSNEQQVIENILELRKIGEDASELETELRKRVFVSDDTSDQYVLCRLFADAFLRYRKDGRNFFRDLAESSKGFFSSKRGFSKGQVETIRYITVLGMSKANGHFEEQSRLMIPVDKFGNVPKLNILLEQRIQETGRAINYADLIYSHHDETFDDQGYLLGPDGKRQILLQVGEAVMFTPRLTEYKKEKIIRSLVKNLARSTVYSGNKGTISNSKITALCRELEQIINIGEGRSYDILYDAFYATVERTLNIGDLISPERVGFLNGNSVFKPYLCTPGNFPSFIKELERLVSDFISLPIGYGAWGWKGVSFVPKLLITTYFDEIVTHDEKDLREYLRERGIKGKSGEYERRDLRDLRRATFLTWSEHIGPITDDDNLPVRDKKGEEIALALFAYHHGLDTGELIELIQGNRELVIPRSSEFGLISDWTNKKNFQYRMGDRRKPNGYGALNTTVLGLPGSAEVVYKTNVDDARSFCLEEQTHRSYIREREAIKDFLLEERKVITPQEYYALQMVLSPNQVVL